MKEDHIVSQDPQDRSALDVGPLPHAIPEAPLTCATCVHMGRIYHDGGLEPVHHCAKGDQRRTDAQKPTGDFSTDFERWWRTFFDATPGQRACKYHEERAALDDASLAVLRQFTSGKWTSTTFATFKNWGPEHMICDRMDKRFVQKCGHASYGASTSTWETTPLGRAELAMAKARNGLGRAPSPPQTASQIPGKTQDEVSQ